MPTTEDTFLLASFKRKFDNLIDLLVCKKNKGDNIRIRHLRDLYIESCLRSGRIVAMDPAIYFVLEAMSVRRAKKRREHMRDYIVRNNLDIDENLLETILSGNYDSLEDARLAVQNLKAGVRKRHNRYSII